MNEQNHIGKALKKSHSEKFKGKKRGGWGGGSIVVGSKAQDDHLGKLMLFHQLFPSIDCGFL